MQSAIKLDGKLFRSFISKPSFQFIDSFIFLNSPPKMLIYSFAHLGLLFYQTKIIPIWLLLILFIYNLFYVFKCNDYKIKYIIPHIFYSITMQISLLIGSLTFKNNKWAKTIHKKI